MSQFLNGERHHESKEHVTKESSHCWNASVVFVFRTNVTETMPTPKCNECGSSDTQIHNTVTCKVTQCNTCGKWLHSNVCGGPVEPDIVCQHCKTSPPEEESDGSTIDDSETVSSESDDSSDLSGFIVDSDATTEESDNTSSEEDEEITKLKEDVQKLKKTQKKMKKQLQKLKSKISKGKKEKKQSTKKQKKH